MRFLRFLGRIARFFLYYLFALVFHWEGLIPAVVLLVLHFWPGIPLFWFFIALGLWMLFVLIRMLFFRFAIRASAEPTPFRRNRNPYSYRAGKTAGGRIQDKPAQPDPGPVPDPYPAGPSPAGGETDEQTDVPLILPASSGEIGQRPSAIDVGDRRS